MVLFHDGQNVFDEGTAYATSWRAGETLDRLAAEGLPLLGVGVPNLGVRRFHEYSPFVDRRWGGGGAEPYVRYLADVVRPLIASSSRSNSVFMGDLLSRRIPPERRSSDRCRSPMPPLPHGTGLSSF